MERRKWKRWKLGFIQPGNPGTEAENGKSEGRNAEEGYELGNAASMVLAVKLGEFDMLLTGRENRYGHPHQETIKRLTDIESKIYSTQENGVIIVEVEDGETMEVGK